MAALLILHGPNLNLLGRREPEVYGSTTLEEIDRRLQTLAEEAGHVVQTLQSNSEHLLIERIHAAGAAACDFIIFNPGAFGHTSIALRDALLGVAIPFIEVHLSNVHVREEFRRHSCLSDIAVGCISGFGADSYYLALRAAMQRLS